jgi:CBS domain-containing protein
MVSLGVNRLPVVDDGRLVGIISRCDVLRIFYRTDVEIKVAVQHALADPLVVPEGQDLAATVADGVVRITGRVSQGSYIRVLEAALRELPGVVDADIDVAIDAESAVPTDA